MLAQMPGYASSRSERSALAHALFSAGQQGALYDPSDLSTLFQDAAGTTPVTADSQPVGLMRDVSGNNNHVSQSTAAARPLYRTDGTLHWIQGDGVDDFLGRVTGPYAAQSWFLAVKSDSTTTATDRIAGRGAAASIFDSSGTWAYFRNQANSVVSLNQNSRTSASAISLIVASASSAEAYINGTLEASYDPDDAITIQGGWGLLALSDTGASPLEGRIYGFAIVNRAVTSAVRSTAEIWLNAKAGL